MARTLLHRIERDNQHFVLDTDTCFCFECDKISWDVLEFYPETPANQIVHRLRDTHPPAEVEEVIGELEWLRSTKSILPLVKPQDQLKSFQFTPGVTRVDIVIDGEMGDSAPARCDAALAMLLGRSLAKKSIHLAVYLKELGNCQAWLSDWVRRAFSTALVAGKELSLSVGHTSPTRHRSDSALASHEVTILHSFQSVAGFPEVLARWHKVCGAALGKTARASEGFDGVGVSVELVPGHGDFSGAVEHLVAQGFKQIDIDLPGAYARGQGVEPSAMCAGIEATAVYYARQLLKKNYFRLEPVAETFHQIYEGTPRPRSDDSGTHLLAVDPAGDLYPSRHFFGVAEHRLGSLDTGTFDEARRAAFDDLGAQTTPSCGACWARNLCGGGHSAIHWALSGGIRRPDATWCDAQRAWFGAAIAAFNLLSTEGVDFNRIYQQLRPGKRPSLWGMARAALTMKVGLRPIEESDAPLLTQWENWSEATYFLGNEYGVFLATRYDREMDSLHPRGIEQEFVIVSRRGAPLGLLKLRPDHIPGVARAWVFFSDLASYSDTSMRGSFARLLREVAGMGAFSTLIVASGPGDGALSDFLQAIGFHVAGREREALFLHDRRHDILLHQLALAT